MNLTLQSTFYILGIAVYSLTLIALIGLIIGIFLIHKKIKHLQLSIQDKLETIENISDTLKSNRFKLALGLVPIIITGLKTASKFFQNQPKKT